MSRKIGNYWENRAVDYLVSNNYKILQRNYIKRYGEIDIIAEDLDNNLIVFVEVKFRHNTNYGYGYEYLTKIKFKKIYNCAQEYIKENNFFGKNYRIDVISYDYVDRKYKMSHFKNVMF